VELTTERVMSIGIQASSTGGLQASPSTGSRSIHATEKRSKHCDDLANTKQISSFFLDYILPLASAINRDSIPCDFEYTLITAYIPKGIRVVGPQLGQIPTLNKNEFNLGDRNDYSMLAPHRYFMRTTGKKLRIVSQPWIKELAQSTILNVINISHFGRHLEVNTCVKLLFSCYHGGYMWLDRHVTMDLALIHWIIGLSMHGPDP
jgi:hypothetical protein